MDVAALGANLRRSISLCPTWTDRREYLASLYSHRLPVAHTRPRGRWITFEFGGDIGRVRLAVRDNRGADMFVIDEVFIQRNYDVALRTRPETVLDLGAHAGYAAIFFARRFPRAALACVEPEPDNVRLLHMNLEANGVTAEVIPAAIAVADGRLRLDISDRDYGHRIAGIPYGRTLRAARIEVDAVSVPTVLDRLDWKRVGLLKIDIEGYEGILLADRAEWLRRVDAICIECHEGFSAEALAEVAARWGFKPPRRERGTLILVRH